MGPEATGAQPGAGGTLARLLGPDGRRHRRRRGASVSGAHQASAADATLDAWYAAVTWEGIRDQVEDDRKAAKSVDQIIRKAQGRTAENVFHKLTTSGSGEPRLLDQQPLLYYPLDIDVREAAKPFLDAHAESLRPD